MTRREHIVLRLFGLAVLGTLLALPTTHGPRPQLGAGRLAVTTAARRGDEGAPRMRAASLETELPRQLEASRVTY